MEQNRWRMESPERNDLLTKTIENFLLEEQLEEKNLRSEEKDDSSFKCEEIKSGFRDIEIEDEPACQVFEKMHKVVSHGWNRRNYKHEIGRNKVRKRRNSCIMLSLSLKLYEMHSKVSWITKKQIGEDAYQLFVKMSQGGNKATTKRKKKKFTKAKGLKYKAESATQIWKKRNKHKKKIKGWFSKKHVIFALGSDKPMNVYVRRGPIRGNKESEVVARENSSEEQSRGGSESVTYSELG